MAKPILLGLINPHNTEDLYIRPIGCSGHRLARMFTDGGSFTEEDYLRCFDRRNLLTSMEDDPYEAAERFRATLVGTSYQVVLLGEAVRRSLDLPKMIIHPLTRDNVTYRQIPHPSGRNQFYNDASFRFLVGDMLRSLVLGGTDGSA